MQDIVSMLKGINPAELNDAVNKAKAFMQTAEGKQMMEKLKKGQPIEGLPVTTQEQNQLIAQLSKNPQMAKQLASILGKK
ncbi:MAG: hypothetical protein ACI4SS_04705 [Clostridia bacterium]